MRMAVVGSKAYFADKPVPQTPGDLTWHVCIGQRYAAQGGIGVWDFEKAGRAVNVRVEGQLVVNNIALARLAALQGAGLDYLPEAYVTPLISTGALLRVLGEWCEHFPGYHLYYSSRRQHTPAFALLLDALRYRK